MGEVYNDLPCTIEDVVGLVGIQVIRNTNTQMHCRCPFCNDRKAHLNAVSYTHLTLPTILLV